MQKIPSRVVLIVKRFASLQLLGIFFAITALLTNPTMAHAQIADGQPDFSLRVGEYDPSMPATEFHFMLDAKPGITLQETVRVVNTGTATGSVNVYPVSATTSQSGGIAYLSKGASPRDVGAWMVMSEQRLTLTPSQSQTISFRIVVPNSASPGQHFGGIAAGNLDPTSSGQNGQLRINVMTRHIMPVQVNLSGALVEQMSVTGAKAGGSNGYQKINLNMANTGNVLLQPTGKLTIKDSQGQLLQDLSLNLNTFLPGTSVDYPVAVQNKALATGDYLLSLALHYGHGKTLNYTTTLTISQQQVQQVFQSGNPLQAPSTSFLDSMPLWQLILVAFAAVVLLYVSGRKVYNLVFARRRKRARATKKAESSTKKRTNKAA